MVAGMTDEVLQHMIDEQGKTGCWYLASPFSGWGKIGRGLDAAAYEASRIAAWFVRRGVRIFCPISHSHAIAVAGDIDGCDHKIWMDQDLPHMMGAVGLIVARMDGWDRSIGVKEEMDFFEERGREIIFFDPPPAPDPVPCKPTETRHDTIYTINDAVTVVAQSAQIAPDSTTPKQETVLEEAARLTSGDRRRDYDHALPNHERIADGWRWYMKGKYGIDVPLKPDDAAWMMVMLKIARDMHSPKRDGAVDVAGYARCVESIREAQGLDGYAP